MKMNKAQRHEGTEARREHTHAHPSEHASLWRDERAGVSLEWALLLAAVALPGYLAVRLALSALAGHYEMMTTINGLPFP